MLFKLKIKAKDDISKYIGSTFCFAHDRHENKYHIRSIDVETGRFMLQSDLFFRIDVFLQQLADGSLKIVKNGIV